MPISNELIDQLLQDCHSPQDLLDESGLLKVLTKRLAERVLEAEMEMHLGYVKHDPASNNSGNSRNGKTSKSVRRQNGEIELDIPRDRNSTFEPTLIGKNGNSLTALMTVLFLYIPKGYQPVIFRHTLKKSMGSMFPLASFLK